MVRIIVLISIVFIFNIACSNSCNDRVINYRNNSIKLVKTIMLADFLNFNCTDFAVDKKENIYLLDSEQVNLIKISSSGRKMNSIIKKGEGPGELKNYAATNFGNHLWLYSSRKICEYDFNDMKLRSEHKLNKPWYDFTPLSNGSWICRRLNHNGKGWQNELWIRNKKGELLSKLFAIDKGEMIYVSFNGRTASFFPGNAIERNLLFCQVKDKVICTDSMKYELTSVDFNGNLIKTRSSLYDNVVFDDLDKKKFIENLDSVPKQLRKYFIEALPDKLCAIERLMKIPNDRLLVRIIIGFNKFRDDIYDENLTYLYTLKNPLFVNVEKCTTFNNKLYVLKKGDNTDFIEIYDMD